MSKFGVQSVRVRCPGYDMSLEEASDYVMGLIGIDVDGGQMVALGDRGPGWLFILRTLEDFKYAEDGDDAKYISVTVGTGELKDGLDSGEAWGF